MPESPLEQRPEPAVISDPAQADLELASLDVDWVVVWDVLLAAQDFYLSLTRNNPSYSFMHVTGSVVRGLRDGLAEHFTPRSLFGLSVTTHHSLGFTILVVRGTPETGLVNGNPSNRSPRGPTTFRSFWAQFQATLPFVEQSPRLKVLLFHIDRVTERIGAELSDPRHLRRDEDGKYHFDGWHKRILLPAPAAPAAPDQAPGIIWTPEISGDALDLRRRQVSE